jgi:hypothetical protein
MTSASFGSPLASAIETLAAASLDSSTAKGSEEMAAQELKDPTQAAL